MFFRKNIQQTNRDDNIATLQSKIFKKYGDKTFYKDDLTISEEEFLKKLREQFDHFDIDGNGTIDEYEMFTIIPEVWGGRTVTEEEVKEGTLNGYYTKAEMDAMFGKGRWRAIVRRVIWQ